MQLKHSLIIFLFFVVVLASCSAQKKGFIVTTSNDTLKGIVSRFLQPKYNSSQIPFIKILNNKVTKSIDVADVRNIDFIDKKKGDTLTYNIFENQLCPVFAQKDDISICKRYHTEDVSSDVDNINNVSHFNTYTDVILFMRNKKKILIYGGSTPYKNEVIGVLNFINSLYHKKFSATDFNDEIAMFNYILNNNSSLSDTTNNTEHYSRQPLLIKGNMKIYMSIYSPFKNLSVLNNTNPDIGTYKAADYLEDINIFSDKQQDSITMYSGTMHTSNIDKEKIVLQFINTRYNLNLSFKDLLTYIDSKKDLEHQQKLFDFILNKEIESESKK